MPESGRKGAASHFVSRSLQQRVDAKKEPSASSAHRPHRLRSSQYLAKDTCQPAIGQALLTAVVVIDKLRVIETEQVQDGGLVVVGGPAH